MIINGNLCCPKQQRSCKSNFASRFVLNINVHQCPLIFSFILASRSFWLEHLSILKKKF